MNGAGIGRALYAQRRAIIALMVVTTVTGMLSWITMPKEEDPSLTNRFGSITVLFPGADVDTLESNVVVPTEDELRTVEEISIIEARMAPNVAIVSVELDGNVEDPEPIWTKVDRALERATRSYPDGAEDPVTDYEVTSTQSVIVAIGGSGDLLELWNTAEELEREIRAVAGVRDIQITPEIDRNVAIKIDNAVSAQLGVTRTGLAAALRPALSASAAGQLQRDTVQATLDSGTEVKTVDGLRAASVALPGRESAALSTLADVRVSPAEPLTAVARLNGRQIVTVGVIPRSEIDVVPFGREVAGVVDAYFAEHPDRTYDFLTFQPARVSSRLNNLLGSLLQGVSIVAAVVVLAMGVRLGLTVAVMVPVVALGGLTIYAASGGVLHQISIAALIMSLGLLVDNAIVVAERVQWRIDRGEARHEAAGHAVRELFVPLAAATGTTLAAYLPLLLARGVTAEFTSAIPRVVMLTLTLSYFFAIAVTPTVAMLALRPQPNTDGSRGRIAGRAGRIAVGRPAAVVGLAGAAVVAVLALIPTIQAQFFPTADRNQFVVDIEAARGTHISETSRMVSRLEDEIVRWDGVESVAGFAGRTAPRFYYNILTVSNASYRGQLLVTTTNAEVVEPLTARVRSTASEMAPGLTVVTRVLGQGPPVTAPIELRVSGRDQAAITQEVRHITETLQAIPGAADVRTTLSAGVPTIAVEPDDARLVSLGISRRQVNAALLAASRGIEIGEIDVNGEQVPVVVRSPAGEHTTPNELSQIRIASPAARGTVPLSAVARISTEFRPVEYTRRNGVRTSQVLAQLAPGAAYNEVLRALDERLAPPPAGVVRTVGGAAEESAEANQAIAQAAYVGVAVLLTILLLQFRSFRKLAIVLTTVPLAAVGVIPGLVVFNQPFGFTSLLGTIALTGIVVNNAIILIDLTDTKIAEGSAISDAIVESVKERFRPILLTAGTTIAGLLPLLFSSASLWPPFASALISGLAASTVLTLMVVPALYRLMFRDEDSRTAGAGGGRVVAGLAIGLAFFGLGSQTLYAQTGETELSISEIAARAAENDAVRAARLEARAASRRVTELRRSGLLPALSVEGEVLRRSEELTAEIGIPGVGTLEQEQEPIWGGQGAVVVSQPLIDVSAQITDVQAARTQARAEHARSDETERAEVVAALARALDIVDSQNGIEAAELSRDALQTQLERVRRLQAEGRALQSDVDRIEIALLGVERDIRDLRLGLQVAQQDLARRLGVDRRPVVGALPEVRAILAARPKADPRVASRPDIRRLDAAIDQLQASRRGVLADHLPTLEGQARGIYVLNSGLNQDSWGEVALQLEWTPFARGRRAAALDRIDAGRRALEAQYRDALLAATVDVEERRRAFISARERYQVQERAVALAERLEAETLQLFEAGRRTSAEYVEAQAEVRRERNERSQAQTEMLRALFAWRRAAGVAIVPGSMSGL